MPTTDTSSEAVAERPEHRLNLACGSRFRGRLAAVCLGAFAQWACAAGGHFDVDDAAMLDVGRCQVETWIQRRPTSGIRTVHLGPACRLGPVEAGLAFDRTWDRGDARASSAGPQLKWVVDPWFAGISAGLAWAAAFDLSRGGRPLQTVYAPITWSVTDTLSLHLNAGRDWDASNRGSRRVGASLEWAATDRLTAIAERVSVTGAWTTRVGTRWTLTPTTSVDVSAARVTGAGRPTRVCTVGLNREFAR